MGSRHAFTVIDSHTGGNPTRLVSFGVPALLGGSVVGKMQYLRAKVVHRDGGFEVIAEMTGRLKTSFR